MIAQNEIARGTTLANGTQLLYFNTTDSDTNASSVDGTSRTYTLNLSTNEVRLFASPQSIDLATGGAVVGGLRNADNLAIDHEGHIYIVEDRGGGSDDDIWFAADWNLDGDITDPGEGLARWASNGTVGSDFTGLYSTCAIRTARSSTFSIPRAASIA